MRKRQVGVDRKRQQASPPHVKDWLKREEILSLLATGSQAVAKTPLETSSERRFCFWPCFSLPLDFELEPEADQVSMPFS